MSGLFLFSEGRFVSWNISPYNEKQKAMTMTTPDPDFQPTSEPSSKPPKRKPKSADEAINSVEVSAADSAVAVKPKRRHKTQAEKEAARKAEAEKPLDPKIRFILGSIVLIIAGFIYIDPVTFAEAGNSRGEGMWIRDVLVILVGILGKTPTVLILTAIGLLSVGMGVWGWLDARKPKVEEKP
jgi:hypothetical protein